MFVRSAAFGLGWLLALVSLGGCATDGRTTLGRAATSSSSPSDDLAWWLAEHPLADGQILRIDELDRTPWSSLHVVQIRNREPLHVHQQHDLDVMLERGRGTLQVGTQHLPLEPGRFIRIPKGTPHAFKNQSRQPAVGVAVFRPPYDGQDSVAVPMAGDFGY